MRFTHVTLKNVASVKANETKPITIDAIERGDSEAVFEIATPIDRGCIQTPRKGSRRPCVMSEAARETRMAILVLASR